MNSDITLYKNTEEVPLVILEDTFTNPYTSITLPTTEEYSLYLGSLVFSDAHFFGFIEEFSLYNKILSIEEVFCLADKCKPECMGCNSTGCTSCLDSINRNPLPTCDCLAGYIPDGEGICICKI